MNLFCIIACIIIKVHNRQLNIRDYTQYCAIIPRYFVLPQIRLVLSMSICNILDR